MKLRNSISKSISLVVVLLFFSGCSICGGDFSIVADPDTMDILKRQKSLLSYDDLIFASGENELHALTSFTLPLTLDEGVGVSWISLDSALVNVSGAQATVNRPSGDTRVVIKAELSLNGKSLSKQLSVTAGGLDFTAETPVNLDTEQIDLSFVNNGATLSHDPEGNLYFVYNAGDGSYEVRGRKISDTGTTDLGVIGYYDDLYDGYRNGKIDFDSSGVPYVLYAGPYAGQLNGGNSYDIFIKKYTGSGWDLVGGGACRQEKRPDLANMSIGADNKLYVSYRNSPGGELSVKSSDGTAWGLVGSEDITGIEMWRSMVFTDASNNLYTISKTLSGYGSNLYMMSYNGSDWSNAGTNPFSDDGVDYFDAETYEGMVYVVYNSGENGDRAKAARFNGTDWLTLGSDTGFSAGSAKWIDLEISTDGVLHVAYSDVSMDKRIFVKRYVDGTWLPVGSDTDFPATETTRIDLAVLADGAVKIAALATGSGSTELVRYTSTR